MLQPQPHIDLLISSSSVLGLEDVWRKETSCEPQPLPGPYWIPLAALTAYSLSSVFLYSTWCWSTGTPPEMRLVLSILSIIQMPTLTLIHTGGTWVRKYSLSVHFPHDCFPLTPLPLLYLCLWTTHASHCSPHPFLQNSLPSTKHLFWLQKTHSICHYSVLTLTISIRFFPLPPLPSAAVQWGCYPCQRCCHHCTPHHHHQLQR